MKNAHRLSDALFDFIYKAVTTRHYWLAFPAESYFLRAGDLHCFPSREEAREFKASLKEVASPTKIIYAPSVLSAYQQIEGHYQHNTNDLITTKNESVMNEKNFEYLKDNLKYLGFGDGLSNLLREEMAKGVPDFQLTFETEINKKAFAAVLNFRKSDNTDMYFVNSYHATLQRSNGEIFDQAFYLNKGKGVTAKEAFNLLEGRAVYKELENKEGQKYGAWIQLDFERRDKNNNHEVRQFHDAYRYDLKTSLEKFNMRDINEPDLADILMQSLKKGNIHAVTMEKDGGAVRMFVEANPQYKSVNLYNSDLKRVPKEGLEHYLIAGVSQGKEAKLAESVTVEGREKKNGKDVPIKDGSSKELSQGKGAGKNEELSEKIRNNGKSKKPKDLLPQKEKGQTKKGVKLS